ncbi:MAG: AAA family ATPase [Candidatus Paracaedimonas acanthamoebae]|uniref:AAA family ATPase n=1 Tax=Candidatus Paracaedimonas acanthamoebae TaxID=244581 RepID=A0A8J7Q0P4_9PROT|nr:AAA family ATPase [Candidatus Paracaedimonas acanthamoebae]
MNAQKKPYIIVLGNEKGGTGKSTLSMHLIVHLLRLGFKIGSIDIDARQGTLSRYIENRQKYIEMSGKKLPTSTHHAILRSGLPTVHDAQEEEKGKLLSCLESLKDKDFILIDTPGSDTFLSQLSHSYADTLITPLNDSFIDLDMLARINSETREITGPSTYAEMVWEQKKHKLLRERTQFDWIVLRNRLSSIFAKNKEEMQNLLNKLSQRIGFRLASGFGERVIFRELFLQGLTLLDLQDVGIEMTLSHVAARQELRALLEMINLTPLSERLQNAN